MLATKAYRSHTVPSTVNHLSPKRGGTLRKNALRRKAKLPRTGSLNDLPAAVDIPAANRNNATERIRRILFYARETLYAEEKARYIDLSITRWSSGSRIAKAGGAMTLL